MKRWLTLVIAAASVQSIGCSRKPVEEESPLAKARTVVENRCKTRWKLLLSVPGARADLPPEVAAMTPQQIESLCRCEADGAAARISLDDLEYYVKETDFRQAAKRTMMEIEKSCRTQPAPG